MKELIIEAKTENLNAVLDFVTREMEAMDCPMKLQMQITVATEEIFVNIAHYAYSPKVGGVTVRVAIDGDVTVEFEDGGVEYNPLLSQDPDITMAAEERKIGGLGVFMVKKIMDTTEYRRDGNRNILKIKKKLVEA